MKKVIYNFQILNSINHFPEKHHLWEEEDTDAGERRAYIKVWQRYMDKKVKLFCIEKS